jgi:hypothetical protein
MSMFRKNDTDASTLYFQSVLDTERHKPYGKLRQHPSKLGQHFIKLKEQAIQRQLGECVPVVPVKE